MNTHHTIVFIILMSILNGCGGSSSHHTPEADDDFLPPPPKTTTITGQFIDDPVEGLIYTCSSGTSGITDTEGTYSCDAGDDVTFAIGTVYIGTIAAQSDMVTPYTLFPNDLDAALNLARLLQSMDADGESGNGHIIIDESLSLLLPSDTDLSSSTFKHDIETTLDITLISAAKAQAHLEDSIVKAGGTIPDESSIPVADAGQDQNIHTMSEVRLDGSASVDADGKSLTYRWSITSRPQTSYASLSGTTLLRPTFVADTDGTYIITLVVNDGSIDSALDMVVITATTDNAVPVADAGNDQNVNTTYLVTLNGSKSSDADLDDLRYLWSFVSRPEGSTTLFSDRTMLTPTFVADKDGTYIIELIVDDGNNESLPNRVIIRAATANIRPVAEAGIDQNVRSTEMVTLDGSNSSDADDDPLSYLWNFVSRPTGSNATLSNTTVVNPAFVADIDGDYTLQLIVNDGTINSLGSNVSITATTQNAVPVANAGTDKYVTSGSTVILDGLASSDADFDTLTYNWRLLHRPDGSNTTLSSSTEAEPTIDTDKEGIYMISLTVDDGTVISAADDVMITAIHNSGTLAENFGLDGTVTHNSAAGGSSDDKGSALVLDSSGNIYVTGKSMNVAGNSDMVIWKYKSDGTPDVSFGTHGNVIHNSAAGGDSSDIGNDIALDSIGNIYVTGYSLNLAGNSDMVIWKYNNDGTADRTFADDGILIHYNRDFSGSGNAIALDNNGGIYVTGMNAYADGERTKIDMMIWKFKSDGTPDKTFSGDGIVTHNGAAGGDGEDIGNALVLDSSGNIYVTGSSFNSDDCCPEPGPDSDMIIWKYNSSGELDSSFNGDGIVVHRNAADGYYYADNGTGIVLDNSGNIYVTGYSDGGDSFAMVIWKYGPNGDLDRSFNIDGTVVYHNLISHIGGDIRHDYGYAIVLDRAENIYVTGQSVDRMAIWKYQDNGEPDSTFDEDGIVFYPYHSQGKSIALDHDGDIYVTGSSHNRTSSDHDMVIWKYE